jgi:SAM-dependent methyltransferase
VDAEALRRYWSEQARIHGQSPSASWTDHRVITLEIAAIGHRVKGHERVLDAGCANGYSSAVYATFAQHVTGVDYAPEMIAEAQVRREGLPTEIAKRLEFRVGDVTALEFDDGAFDAVVATRVVINQPSWEVQLQALGECARVLARDGLLLLSEATEQGWRRLNALRREWGLTDIPMPSFNRYLDEERMLESIDDLFAVEELVDFASSYYVATRLFKPLLAHASGAPIDVGDPNAEFNRWAAALPPAGDYGTQKLFVLRRL